jgi:hypothetical protein
VARSSARDKQQGSSGTLQAPTRRRGRGPVRTREDAEGPHCQPATGKAYMEQASHGSNNTAPPKVCTAAGAMFEERHRERVGRPHAHRGAAVRKTEPPKGREGEERRPLTNFLFLPIGHTGAPKLPTLPLSPPPLEGSCFSHSSTPVCMGSPHPLPVPLLRQFSCCSWVCNLCSDGVVWGC